MLKRTYADSYYILGESSQKSIEAAGILKSRKLSEDDMPLIKIPKVQRGLVVSTFERDLAFASDLPVKQHLKEYEILVQNKYVGLNHVDWKSKKYRFNIYSFPWINGRESSGIVVRRGSKVDKQKFPIAAEVFLASTSYRDLETSTFQEYTVFDSRLVWKLPQYRLPNGRLLKRFDLEFAAGIGVGLVTAGSAISSLVDLSPKDQADHHKLGNIVIWGGSSSVGLYVIQLAKASKKFEKIVVVSASKHKEYLLELGASYIIDRHQSEEEILGDILSHCPEGIDFGIDVISKETATLLTKILQNNNENVKRLVCIVGVPHIATELFEKNSKTKFIIETVNIKRFHEDIAFGSWFVDYTSRLFESGKLKPIKALKIFKSLDNFGEGIKSGLKELEERGASAEKFVASL